jgi:hypothetical protein
MDCHMSGSQAMEAATLEAEVVNYNEVTSIGAIAASYLCGRRILLNGKVYTIGSVWQTIGSRMALTIACEGGPTKRVYLPSRIELMPENGEQD